MSQPSQRPVVALFADGLVYEINGKVLVSAFSADPQPGAVHVIVGPNGAGKTTVLRMLAGLLVPARGSVRLGERPITALAPAERARALAVHLEVPDGAFPYGVQEIVGMGRHPYQNDATARASDSTAIQGAMVALDVLGLCDRPFPALSAGEKQRVALARVLAQDTPVVLLDEPLARLDPFHVERVLAVLTRLAAEGRTVVVIAHDLDVAARLADVIYVMHEGALRASGPPEEVLTAALIADVWGIDVDFVQGRRLDGGPRRVIAIRGAIADSHKS